MARKTIKKIEFRRKSEGKTDYKKRLSLLISRKPRLVIRKSLKNMTAQIVGYDEKGDKILASSHSSNIVKLGWKHSKNNIPACYLVGLLLGKMALNNKVKEAIVDTGLQTIIKGSKLFAVVKGATDAGLKIPYSEEIMPSEERIKGKHISDYNQKSKDITKDFESLKQKIMEK